MCRSPIGSNPVLFSARLRYVANQLARPCRRVAAPVYAISSSVGMLPSQPTLCLLPPCRSIIKSPYLYSTCLQVPSEEMGRCVLRAWCQCAGYGGRARESVLQSVYRILDRYIISRKNARTAVRLRVASLSRSIYYQLCKRRQSHCIYLAIL